MTIRESTKWTATVKHLNKGSGQTWLLSKSNIYCYLYKRILLSSNARYLPNLKFEYSELLPVIENCI